MVIEVRSLRQLAGQLKTENDRLRQQTSTNSTRQPQPLDITDIEIEVRSLGVELNTTIVKLIQQAPPEATNEAVKSLREAIAENRVENRTGFLNKAIRDAWKPNKGHEEKNDRDLFNEWFPWAKTQGLVVASIQHEEDILVLTPEGDWTPFKSLVASHPKESQ